jgi:hypothetical protein
LYHCVTSLFKICVSSTGVVDKFFAVRNARTTSES